MKQGDVWWLQHCVRIWIYGEEDKPVEIKWKYAAVRAKDTSCCNECQTTAEGAESVYLQLFTLALNLFVYSDGRGHRIALLIRLNANIFLFSILALIVGEIGIRNLSTWEILTICQMHKRPADQHSTESISICTEKAQEAETLFAWAKSCTL